MLIEKSRKRGLTPPFRKEEEGGLGGAKSCKGPQGPSGPQAAQNSMFPNYGSKEKVKCAGRKKQGPRIGERSC